MGITKQLTTVLSFALTTLLSFSTLAAAMYTTYQAKIIKPDGNPLEATSVNFRFTILDPAGACILYSENFNTINMSGTAGLVYFSLGSGIKTYPTSGTVNFSDVFNNQVSSLSCDTGGPASYTPTANDLRKIVMQFHDGTGWQTLPAMSINHVPYAMYARNAASATTAVNSLQLNGKTDLNFVQVTSIPTCSASQALQFNGASFGCVAVGSGGGGGTVLSVSGTAPIMVTGSASAPVISISVASMSSNGYLTSADYATFSNKLNATSAAVISALGYTPADTSAVGSSFSTVTANVSNLSSSMTTLNSTVSSLSTSVGAIVSSQWNTSGTMINYMNGNVGIGTTNPRSHFDVSGSVTIGDLAANNASLTIYTRDSGSVSQGIVLIDRAAGYGSWQNPSGFDGISANSSGTVTGWGQLYLNYYSSGNIDFNNGGGHSLFRNRVAIGMGTTPTANLHLAGGTSSTAALKFTSGTLLASPQAGVMEYNGFNFYITDGTNTRRAIATGSSSGTIDNASNINSTSNMTMTPVGSVIVSSTTTSTNSNTGALVVKGGLGVAGNINTAANLNVSGSSTIDGSLQLSSMTSGSVLFAGANGTITQDNSSFYWDGANKRLGLGTTTPSFKIEVSGTAVSDKKIGINGTQVLYLPDQSSNGFRGSLFVGNGGASMTHSVGSEGQYNTGVGIGALYSNTSGNENTATGNEALYFNTTGQDNTATGNYALHSNTTGSYNTANGYMALYSSITGYDNVANGYYSLYSNTSGSRNTAAGNYALYSNTSGDENTATGNSALESNQAGIRNTATGQYALSRNKTKSESTAVGYGSMRYADDVSATVTSSYNTAIGAYSLQGSITAANNTGIRNTALGHSALKNMTSGSSNTAIGYNAGSAITTGSNNVILGSNDGSSIATSSNNIILSDGAGTERMRVNSSGYVGIGITTPGSRLVVKGAGTTSATTTLNITDSSNNSNFYIRDDGRVGIGSTSPEGKMEVAGLAWGNYASSAATSYYPFNTAAQGSSFMEITNTATGYGAPGSYLGLKSTAMSGTPYQRAYIGIVSNMGASNYTPNIVIGQQTGATAYQERLRIDSTGNVGIGTAAPINLLHAHASAGNTVFRMSNASTGTTGSDGFVIQQTATDVNLINYEAGAMAFQTTATERMRITSAGAVGIGTTNPSATLHVSGSLLVTDRIKIQGTAGLPAPQMP